MMFGLFISVCATHNGMHRSIMATIGPLVLILALFAPVPPSGAIDGREVLALDSIFNSYPTVMSSFGWTTDFSSACNESTTWNRTISCTDDHITVIAMIPTLNQAETKFSLSEAWSGFIYLEEIVIIGLNITGNIPADFNNLVNLSIVSLPFNELTGFIPDLSATKLSFIDLTGNSLSGTIPDYLFSLPTMADLRLSGNWFHGPIPDSNWTQSIRNVILRDNLLNGSIPSQAASALKLDNLILDSNRLSGTIPYRLFSAPIRSFTIFGNMIDICSGLLLPQPTNLQACAILPQFFDQTECNCTQKWNSQCGALPTSCPECSDPAPTPGFKCSTTESGWWTETVYLKAGQVADFRGTSSNSPAVVLGSFVAEPGSTIIFGFNSAVQTRGTLHLFGSVKVLLTSADTVYLGNQISSDLYHRTWLPVKRTYFTSLSTFAQTSAGWTPEVDIPQVCHYLSAQPGSENIPNPFRNLNLYSVTFQYQEAVRFRCSSWIIVIGVFSGALILGLILFISCYVYSKAQARKRELARMPLLR